MNIDIWQLQRCRVQIKRENKPPMKEKEKRRKLDILRDIKDPVERRRAKDHQRKRKWRDKIKGQTVHHATIPKQTLFTMCAECKGDCWFKEDTASEKKWVICKSCHGN